MPIYVYLMGKRLAVFLNSFLLLQSFFWVKNAKIVFFLGKNGFESCFYKIDVKMITNWSVRLEKHQIIDILLMVDFLRISKMLHLSKFFEILKFTSISWYNCKMHLILFEHCRPNTVKLDLSIFGDYCLTTTVHFRFQCKSLKIDLVALYFFFQFSKKDGDVW